MLIFIITKYTDDDTLSRLVLFPLFAAELGDHDPEVHSGNYITDYELVARQTHELEEKAMELHQKLKGLTPSEADILFLKKAATLDTYGIDPNPVKVSMPFVVASPITRRMKGKVVKNFFFFTFLEKVINTSYVDLTHACVCDYVARHILLL